MLIPFRQLLVGRLALMSTAAGTSVLPIQLRSLAPVTPSASKGLRLPEGRPSDDGRSEMR